MTEILRFAQEFREIDPKGRYSIEDYVDWLALACANPPRFENGHRPRRMTVVE